MAIEGPDDAPAGGRERSETELAGLLHDGGFRVTGVVELGPPDVAVEAAPVRKVQGSLTVSATDHEDADLPEETVALQPDCVQCFALCCVAPGFSVSPEFAIDKSAGTPCLHLQKYFRCGIHSRQRDKGFTGCTLFECHGAGQKVSQVTFDGRDWRTHPELADEMFRVFGVMRDCAT